MNKNIAAVRPGILLAMLTLLFGIGMGIGFGINEDGFQDYIAEGISAHPQLHDEKSQHKIWRYAQRAHFHATGVGAFTLALTMVVAFSGLRTRMKTLVSTLIGLGGTYALAWYSQFWLAPELGRHGAHSALITEMLTYIGVGSLLVGMLMLFAHLLLGLWQDPSAS